MTVKDRKRLLETEKICKIAVNEIWKNITNEDGNWENHIFDTYDRLANQFPMFRENVKQNDFWLSINNIDQYLNKSYNEITEVEFEKHVIEYLCTFENYSTYFTIINTHDFPTGLQIGRCRSYSYSDLPKDVKDEFEYYWGLDYIYHMDYGPDKESVIERKKSYLFMRVDVITIGPKAAITKASTLVEDGLNILRFTRHYGLQHTGFIVRLPRLRKSEGQYGHGKPNPVPIYPMWHDKTTDKEIKNLTCIFTKKTPHEIERRIHQAITKFGMSLTLDNPHVKLPLLISALNLLTTKDYQNIGDKIAKRVATLVSIKKYHQVISDIKYLIKKRDEEMHQGLAEISDDDIKMAEEYTKETIKKITELRNCGFRTIDEINQILK